MRMLFQLLCCCLLRQMIWIAPVSKETFPEARIRILSMRKTRLFHSVPPPLSFHRNQDVEGITTSVVRARARVATPFADERLNKFQLSSALETFSSRGFVGLRSSTSVPKIESGFLANRNRTKLVELVEQSSWPCRPGNPSLPVGKLVLVGSRRRARSCQKLGTRSINKRG